MRRFSLFLLLLFCVLTSLRADEPRVTANISEPSVAVGEATQFQITVAGARQAQPPGRIAVEGLDIQYSGQSTKVEMRNFDMEMSVIYAYSVTPQRAGKFTIPAQRVDVSGKQYATNPVALEVGAGGTAGNTGSGGELARAEIVVPKETAFLGESIPVELRIYVDTRVRWELQQPPQFQGEGFTAQKLTDPVQSRVTKDGRTYDAVTYKTAITPAKTGTIALGPFEINAIAQVPQQRRQRPRFGVDDFDSLFNDPFGAFGQRQRLTFKSEPVQLQVRSLPPHAPKSFTGAVGQFTLSTAAAPLKVNVGEPVTLTLKLKGRGNFDRVGAPELLDDAGWRGYPASGKFVADDNVGISGTKTFEMAVIPEERQTTTPAVEFSYLDPLTEKYVTLKAEQVPITVRGDKAPAPAASIAPESETAAVPTPTPVPRVEDIHYIRTGSGNWGRSFEPLYERKEFWALQAVPLVALLGLVGFQIRQRKARNFRAHEIAELRRGKVLVTRKLRDEALPSGEFYDAAARCIQIETALHSDRPAMLVDAEAATASRPLDDALSARIRSIFEARAEALYAGHGGTGKVVEAQRATTLEAIQKFENAHV